MTTVNVYQTFNGNREEAFNFYKSVFDCEFSYLDKFKDMPSEGGSKMSAENAEKIMHILLPIGGDPVLMAGDTGVEWAPNYSVGNNFSISIHADSTENE